MKGHATKVNEMSIVGERLRIRRFMARRKLSGVLPETANALVDRGFNYDQVTFATEQGKAERRLLSLVLKDCPSALSLEVNPSTPLFHQVLPLVPRAIATPHICLSQNRARSGQSIRNPSACVLRYHVGIRARTMRTLECLCKVTPQLVFIPHLSHRVISRARKS